jgi:hypothetical protein
MGFSSEIIEEETLFIWPWITIVERKCAKDVVSYNLFSFTNVTAGL